LYAHHNGIVLLKFDGNGADNNENNMDVQTGLILKENGRDKAVDYHSNPLITTETICMERINMEV
jgi:hypothetical protein